ncbi:hypothetical protein ACU8KH_01209 [Lachancea thermotolerans]
MCISHLCFSSVCDFIKSYKESSQDSPEVFELLSKFLKDNKPLLLEPAKFNELGAEVPSKTTPLVIGSAKYNISVENWKDASRLSRALNVSYEQSLRIVAQSDARSCLEKDRMFLYAQRILQERNAIVDAAFLILNWDCKYVPAKEDLISTISIEKTTLCSHLISLLSDVAANFGSLDKNNSIWSQPLQDLKDCQDVFYAIRIMELLTLLIMNSDTPVGIVSSWCSVLKTTNYFQCFSEVANMPREVPDKLEALATINTVLMLGFDVSTFTIKVESPFFNDPECFKTVNKTLLDQPSSAIILYYWSFVLSLKSYLFEEYPEKNAKFLDNVFGTVPVSHLISLMVKRSEELDVLVSFTKFSGCLEQDKLWSVTLSSLMALSLNFINITPQAAKTVKELLTKNPRSFVEKFLTNNEVEKKVALLRAKVPLLEEGLLPLIHLSTVHPDFANFEWKELNTYTEKLRLSSLSYDLADLPGPTSESSDIIVLKQELLVKPPLESQSNVMMPIPKETRGKIIPITSTAEDAVVFMHDYNGWSLLGRILQNICDTYTQSEEDEAKREKSELAVAIIDLVANTMGAETPIERSTEILQHLSGYVEDDDIISVLFKLFELALHSRNLPIINAGLNLMIELTPNFSHFVWTHLARSYLIDRNGKEGLAISILGNIERTSGVFQSSILLIKLASCLVSESLTATDIFPERMKKEILGHLMAHLINIYEGFQFQTYTMQWQYLEIGLQLTSLISKVLFAVYGVDFTTSPSKKVTGVLADAAQIAVGAFLGASTSEMRAANSLITIVTFAKNTNVPLHRGLPFGEMRHSLIDQSFGLANLLISVRSLLHLPPSSLERSFFIHSATLVDIYASHLGLRVEVIKLLTHLVRAPFDTDAPSLLAYLGDDHSKMLLNCTAYDLKAPLLNQKLSKSLYSFFSAIMEGKQDGLAILFLTGKLITLNKGEELEAKNMNASNSILTILKNNALKLDDLPEAVNSHLLDAIAYACNSWTAARTSENDEDFIRILVRRLELFQPHPVDSSDSIEKVISLSNQYKVISRIAEILALSLFTSTANNEIIMKALNRPELASTVKSVFHIDGYNTKLQSGLQEKFRARWPQLELYMFTSSPLLKSNNSFHTSIFDIPLMDQYFEQDENWSGGEGLVGFRSEVIAASVNLQFVTYQISAAKSWGALLTSFIKKTPTPLSETYVDIAEYLLQANPVIGADPSIFKEVYLARIELAFYILYSFAKTKKSVPDSKLTSLLLGATDTIKSKEVAFLQSVVNPVRCSYYRPLIRSILIIFSLVKNKTIFVESLSDHILEYFELTFGKGVNLVLSSLLSEINTFVSHGKKPVIVNLADKIQDLFLLLSTFTKIKDLHPPSSFEMVLASSLNEVGTIKTILNLYSSSHLLNFEKEPVLCDLSLTFITELCSVESVAEKMINNGLFSVLLESPISVAIQQGKITPQHQPRLHTIWSDGLLTIVLQLLSKFGKRVLPECCLFVSYFSQQISSAIASWSDQSLAVSTAVIKETSQLIMLQQLFNALDYQEYLTDSNMRTKVVDNTEIIELFFGLDTDAEKRELSASFRHLLTHPKYLNSRIVPTTLEEHRLLESEDTRSQFVKRIVLGIKDLQEGLFAGDAC